LKPPSNSFKRKKGQSEEEEREKESFKEKRERKGEGETLTLTLKQKETLSSKEWTEARQRFNRPVKGSLNGIFTTILASFKVLTEHK
jgi:hypothetical protein